MPERFQQVFGKRFRQDISGISVRFQDFKISTGFLDFTEISVGFQAKCTRFREVVDPSRHSVSCVLVYTGVGKAATSSN